MNIRDQYKHVVGNYDAARRRELSRYVTYPSIMNLAGRLDGKDVLDFGCGSGFSTRTLATLNPKTLFGMDAVPEQLALAKKYESENPMGIVYCGPRDISKRKLGFTGSFDLVTAVQVLTYMPTKERFRNAIGNASKNLTLGGRFIGMTGTPRAFREGNTSYGLEYVPQEKHMRDGSPVKVKLKSFNGFTYNSFDCHYYSEQTFQEAFEEAGLTFRFLKPIVTLEGLEARGHKFWKDFLENPPIILFEGRKK